MSSQSYRIIDVHTHTYPEAIAQKATENLGNFYQFIVHGEGTYTGLEKEALENGVSGFFLFCVATNAHQVPKVNDSIAALCKKAREHGLIAEGFAGMHQDFPCFEEEVDRCRAMGLHGVKLHPDIQGIDVDSEKLLPLYEILQQRGMKLFLHVGDDRPQYRFSEPKKVARIAKMFPRMQIVAAHLGGYKAWDEAEDYLYGMDNVWYDCSSGLWAMTPEKAAEIISKCGYDRVMFGTDYPVMHLKDYLDLFFKVPLTEQQRIDILSENAFRFLKS